MLDHFIVHPSFLQAAEAISCQAALMVISFISNRCPHIVTHLDGFYPCRRDHIVAQRQGDPVQILRRIQRISESSKGLYHKQGCGEAEQTC